MKIFSVALFVLALSAPALAQNKREMQMMADIRMLQEQNQQLQVELQTAIAQLNDLLKAINTRVDEQAAATRKGFADQAVKVEQFVSDLRVVREGVSESNVRIGQLAQELEAVRLSIPQYPPPAAPGTPLDPTGAAAPGTPATAGGGTPGVTPPPAAALPPLAPGTSPQRIFDTAQADYYAGQWQLCVSGFEMFLGYFPKSQQADQAQFYIGECHFQDGKWQEAIGAYNQVIASHPRSASAASAYFKRGLALERLDQFDRARESYEAAMKNFPDSAEARLAKQAVDRLNRRKP